MKLRLLLGVIALLTAGLAGTAWWMSDLYHRKETKRGLWQVQLSDIKGHVHPRLQPNKRPLVVNFWASWCAPCREEMPELAELALSFQGRVDFVGIAVDNTAAVQQYLATVNIPYPILLGEADTFAIMQAEGNTLGGLPFTIVYTAEGHPIMTKAGKISKDDLEQQLIRAIDLSP